MATIPDYSRIFSSGYRDPADVAWKMGRILLKYRPIAPKPTSGANPATPPVSQSKRKGGGDKYSRRGRKRRNRSPAAVLEAGAFLEERKNVPSPSSSSSELVTLPLMPVAPERKVGDGTTPSPTSSSDRSTQPPPQQRDAWRNVRMAAAPQSAVTVECVTDTWQMAPLATAEVLENDPCPGFVSDGKGSWVTWTNSAYRKMVVGPGGREGLEVELDGRGMVPEKVACFTCRARVKYVCRDRGEVHMVAPCDVWRLADGRLAWRLDVNAALSLCL